MNRLDSFSIQPLSAGDIIDRAARLYRRDFLALLRIVLAPSLIAYLGTIAWAVGTQSFSLTRGGDQFLLSFLLLTTGFVLFLVGKVCFFVVLGGTSRAMVNHFLDGSPLRAREVFRAVRERFWSLLGATVLVMLLLFVFFIALYVIAVLGVLIYSFSTAWVARDLPVWAQVIFHVFFGVLFLVSLLTLALLIYGRLIYIPQALMVEGKGVFSALSRSFTLAGGNLFRLAAIFLFWSYIVFSVYLLLLIPLNWYAYLNGVDINPFGAQKPLWYLVSQQTLTQVSEILLAPIAVLSFTILYIDSRVRKEGFDLELLANRRLAAVSYTPSPQSRTSVPVSPVPSILGLNDYRPAPLPLAPDIKPETITAPTNVTTTPAVGNDPLRSFCQSCGVALLPADRFCRRCGATVPEEALIGEGGEKWSE